MARYLGERATLLTDLSTEAGEMILRILFLTFLYIFLTFPPRLLSVLLGERLRGRLEGCKLDTGETLGDKVSDGNG
jgi:hypothetical protein